MSDKDRDWLDDELSDYNDADDNHETYDDITEAADEPKLRAPYNDYVGDDEYVSDEDCGGDDDEFLPDENSEPVCRMKPSEAAKARRKKKKNPLVAALSNLFPWKGDSRPEVIRKSVFLGCLVVLGVSGGYVLEYFREARNSENVYEDFRKEFHGSDVSDSNNSEYEFGDTLLPEADRMLKQNSDIVGWIQIEDTKIDLPVLQAVDNDYYLWRDVNRNDSEYGAIFLDYRNVFGPREQSGNLVIYGHDTSTNAMFGDLDQYHFMGLNFLKSHSYFTLNSNYKRSKYIIFAVAFTNANEEQGYIWPYHNILDFSNEAEFNDFVLGAKKRSIYKTFLDVKYGDKLATLSTCATTVFEDARLIIIGREVRADEKPDQYINQYTINDNPLYPDPWYRIRGGSYKEDPNAIY